MKAEIGRTLQGLRADISKKRHPTVLLGHVERALAILHSQAGEPMAEETALALASLEAFRKKGFDRHTLQRMVKEIHALLSNLADKMPEKEPRVTMKLGAIRNIRDRGRDTGQIGKEDLARFFWNTERLLTIISEAD